MVLAPQQHVHIVHVIGNKIFLPLQSSISCSEMSMNLWIHRIDWRVCSDAVVDDTIVTVNTISLVSYVGATIALMLNEFIMNAQVKLCLRLVLNWIQIDHRAHNNNHFFSLYFFFVIYEVRWFVINNHRKYMPNENDCVCVLWNSSAITNSHEMSNVMWLGVLPPPPISLFINSFDWLSPSCSWSWLFSDFWMQTH